MKVKVNNEECIGCGACVATCPNVFEMSDDGYAVAKAPEVAEGDVEACKDAAEGCRVSAISAEE